MTRLILMRHAKSDWSTARSDHDRPLNARGRNAATVLGHWLRDNAYVPDQILSSTSLRTRETVSGLGIDTGTTFLRALYLGTPTALLDAIRCATGKTLLLVAHNPGIGDLAAQIITAPPRHDRFFDYPTGATLVADFPHSWDKAELRQAQVVDFTIPRELS